MSKASEKITLKTETPGDDALSALPRIAMLSIHGYVSGNPPLGSIDTGGQVVYVLELSRKLAALGHEVDIWTRRFDGQPAEEVIAPGVRIIRVACGPQGFLRKEDMHGHVAEWCDNALNRILAEGVRYRFVNSHYWDAGLAGMRLASAMRIPHFHTPHSLGLAKMRRMEQAGANLAPYNFPLRIASERAIFAKSDVVVATTNEMADMIARDYEGPAERTHMIPPGYDDAVFYPVGEASRAVIRKRLGFEGTVFFSLGRLARTKGFDLLIRAFALTAKRVPDAMLALGVGGDDLPPERRALLDELKAIATECGVADRVRFLGPIPHRKTPDHYRAADVFVLGSRVEPFGMTAVEAMACGTPTIVTVHGGLHRALTFGRNALFADPFDTEDLGIMMMKPAKLARLRNRLARMGAHRARSLFTWTGIAQQLLRLSEGGVTEMPEADDIEWDEPWSDPE